MHLTDADLGATLDPTTFVSRGGKAYAHAATCANCHGAIRLAHAADQDTADLLHLIDHAAPSPDYAWVERRARVSEPGPVEMDELPSPAIPTALAVTPRVAGHTWSMLDWAARPPAGNARTAIRWGAIALGVSAAAAAAMPSVRHFIARAAAVSHNVVSPTARVARAGTQTASNAPGAPRGVAIVADRSVTLIFRRAPAGSVLHIHPAEGATLAVTASLDGSNYAVGRRTIVIEGGAPGTTYDIALPASARLPDVSIRIGDTTVFLRHGPTVHTEAAARPDDSYTIPVSDHASGQ